MPNSPFSACVSLQQKPVKRKPVKRKPVKRKSLMSLKTREKLRGYTLPSVDDSIELIDNLEHGVNYALERMSALEREILGKR